MNMRDFDPGDNPEQGVARRSERLFTSLREFEALALAVSYDFELALGAVDAAVRNLTANDRSLDIQSARGVRAVGASVAAMQAMIDSLRDLCQMGSGALAVEPLDMDALVRDAWAKVEDRDSAWFSVGKLPAARGHRGLLTLAWTKLLANAARRCARTERPRIEVAGGASGDFAVYSVVDSGEGLDADCSGKLQHVFECIQQRSKEPGAGVDLAIVQRIVTRHRGNVWVEAHQGRGAMFQFSLPLGGAPHQ
jgi:chemotaxis family two-component system sensor kinase Cph1